MQLVCPHCRNSQFTVLKNRCVYLQCLVCGRQCSIDGVEVEPPHVFAKPRMEWVFK